VAHYFEANQPVNPADTWELQVDLAGRPTRVLTAPGVFSGRRLDLGTAVLLRTELRPSRQGGQAGEPAESAAAGAATNGGQLEPVAGNLDPGGLMAGLAEADQSTHLLDLGCGWGPIALVMARLAPQATVWAVDVNPRAVDLTSRNADRLGLPNIRAVLPEAVPEATRFARIWSNPPIRIGKPELRALLTTWLGRLTANGWADLVVQKNLGADSLARWLETAANYPTERLASAKGFRVLRCHSPNAAGAEVTAAN
jgi:16S rRNA G1207 methylase RsmC